MSCGAGFAQQLQSSQARRGGQAGHLLNAWSKGCRKGHPTEILQTLANAISFDQGTAIPCHTSPTIVAKPAHNEYVGA